MVHLALWRLGRDPVHGWIVVTFAGLIFNVLSLAGGSIGAEGRLGDSRGWLLLGTVALPTILVCGVRMFRGLLGVARTTWRRATEWLVVALGVANAIRAFVFVLSRWSDDVAPTWEEMARSGALSFVAPLAIFTSLFAVLVEGGLAVRRGNRIGWLPFTVVPLMIGVTVVETLSKFSGDRGAALVGLQGLFFVVPASMVVVVRYARAMRAERQAGGYSLIRRLSAGGMGELWLASRVGVGGFERKVALKRVLHERGSIDDASIDRLLAEARLSARLTHPNVIAVHDVGRLEAEEPGGVFGWFIAMEWLPGVNLAEVRDAARAADEPLPAGFVAHVGQQACLGLAHAHANGIVHRDVSPQNVMVTFDGAVKVVDFGIAVNASERREGADAGYAVGKFPYMSPEMLRHGRGSAGSDLHALGVMLYELLAGRRPFQGGTRVEIAESVLAGRFTPLRSIRPDVPETLAACVERAIGGVNENGRFTSAEEMERALGVALSETTVPRIGELVRRLCKFAFRESQGTRESDATKTRPSAADDVPTRQLPE